MNYAKLVIFSFVVLTHFAQAMNPENPIMHFKSAFPSLTKINKNKCKSVASNGLSSFTAGGILYPENESDLLEIVSFYTRLKKNLPSLPPMVIAAGSRKLDDTMKSGWSFDCHAQGHNGDIVLSTSKLSGFYQPIDWREFDRNTGVVKVWAYAGTPWRHLVDLVNDAYQKEFNDDEHYFVPLISPTGSNITIGGSFASNTHSRASSVMGGYFADTIDAFHIATSVDGRPSITVVNKLQNEDLFYALVGSFGRGGVVSAMKINLQLVPIGKVATTTVKKVFSIDDVTRLFAEDRARMKASIDNGRTDRQAFLATVGLISADFKTYFMMENDLKYPNTHEPPFPLYTAPNWKAMFIQRAARVLPTALVDFAATKFFDAHCAENICEFFNGDVTGTGLFHNQPLNNYVFFQDSFARNIVETKPKDHQTAHVTLMLRLENLTRVTNEIERISSQPQFKMISFELQDLLPLPSTKVLMAPGYSPIENDDVYIAYTISWVVTEDTKALTRMLEACIEQELYDTKINGEPLAWLHPLKEFSFMNGRIKFYREAAEQLERVLKSYGIDDSGLFYSRIHDYLYGPRAHN